jgi:hypothetical protein
MQNFIIVQVGKINKMSAPHIHSISSAKKWGGKMEDYMTIHKKMDCSKAYIADNRHRALTHNMFWILEVMVPLFGDIITNSDGKLVSVKDICELHVLEDFRMRFIPTAQDYLENIEWQDWFNNGASGYPSSAKKLLIRKQKEINND